MDSKFLLLEQNYMSLYMLHDIEDLDNVRIVHSKSALDNGLLNALYNIHHSGRINRYCKLPFQSIWNRIIFGKKLKQFTPDYVVFSHAWYSDHLVSYFRKNYSNVKLILRFSDKVVNSLGAETSSKIEKIKKLFDGILVYSQDDANQYGLTYHSMGYSAIKESFIKPCPQYDVVFIGADKGRIDKIRNAYNRFRASGLSCFFYVYGVKEQDRIDDGIVYADKVMPFCDYISYEVSAKCLFEIIQEGTTGRTYRMMESIIYNKPLITDCKEILDTPYYNQEYVQLYSDVSEIDPNFVKNISKQVDFGYKGDFSPIRDLEFIENKWKVIV